MSGFIITDSIFYIKCSDLNLSFSGSYAESTILTVAGSGFSPTSAVTVSVGSTSCSLLSVDGRFFLNVTKSRLLLEKLEERTLTNIIVLSSLKLAAWSGKFCIYIFSDYGHRLIV